MFSYDSFTFVMPFVCVIAPGLSYGYFEQQGRSQSFKGGRAQSGAVVCSDRVFKGFIRKFVFQIFIGSA